MASMRGGTTEALRIVEDRIRASLIWAALMEGNSDHKSAIAPVTNGTATLVPPSVRGSPLVPRLVMPAPGAKSPRLPIELLKFDSFSGLPWRSHATTGMTQGWRVIAELPSVP